MDGQVYAVKKIRMKDNSVLDENPCIERIMREVQSLAGTFHFYTLTIPEVLCFCFLTVTCRLK